MQHTSFRVWSFGSSRNDSTRLARDGAIAAYLSGSLLLVAQFTAQDFSDIGLGQVGPELDLFRHFIVGELSAAVLDDVLSRDTGILLDDEGLHRLAGLGVRHADHGAFQHAGVTNDHFLDL